MTDKVLRVIVKNRLGRKYGSLDVDIRENEERTAGQRVGPGDDARLPRGKTQMLKSVEIETGKLKRQAALTAFPSIPITIESPMDCHVSITQVPGQNKWKLEFDTVKPLQTISRKDTTGGGDPGGDPDNVNVTLGGDEPPPPQPVSLAPMFFTGAAIFPLAWFISSCLSNAGSIVWYGIPIAAAAGGIIGGFIARKKKKE